MKWGEIVWLMSGWWFLAEIVWVMLYEWCCLSDKRRWGYLSDVVWVMFLTKIVWWWCLSDAVWLRLSWWCFLTEIVWVRLSEWDCLSDVFWLILSECWGDGIWLRLSEWQCFSDVWAMSFDNFLTDFVWVMFSDRLFEWCCLSDVFWLRLSEIVRVMLSRWYCLSDVVLFGSTYNRNLPHISTHRWPEVTCRGEKPWLLQRKQRWQGISLLLAKWKLAKQWRFVSLLKWRTVCEGYIKKYWTFFLGKQIMYCWCALKGRYRGQ